MKLLQKQVKSKLVFYFLFCNNFDLIDKCSLEVLTNECLGGNDKTCAYCTQPAYLLILYFAPYDVHCISVASLKHSTMTCSSFHGN